MSLCFTIKVWQFKININLLYITHIIAKNNITKELKLC